MPAEGPQGIGPLYVSCPQFASQNCEFSHPQWKSPLSLPVARPPPPHPTQFAGWFLAVLLSFSDSSRRPPCSSLCDLSVKSPLWFSPKKAKRHSRNCAAPRILLSDRCYPLSLCLKTPLPKNPRPTPPIPIPTPTPYAPRALAKSGSLQPFSRSSHSQAATFVLPSGLVPRWPCNPSG
jgi:hypothetical protein